VALDQSGRLQYTEMPRDRGQGDVKGFGQSRYSNLTLLRKTLHNPPTRGIRQRRKNRRNLLFFVNHRVKYMDGCL
jgi:hypothetical protein